MSITHTERTPAPATTVCWYIDREAEDAPHFASEHEAEAERDLWEHTNDETDGPVRRMEAPCFIVRCECGEYQMGEDDDTVGGFHFADATEAIEYARSVGIPITTKGEIPCAHLHDGETRTQEGFHIGRDWTGHTLEDTCPCPTAPCGLVKASSIDPNCREHATAARRSIRQLHSDRACVGMFAHA